MIYAASFCSLLILHDFGNLCSSRTYIEPTDQWMNPAFYLPESKSSSEDGVCFTGSAYTLILGQDKQEVSQLTGLNLCPSDLAPYALALPLSPCLFFFLCHSVSLCLIYTVSIHLCISVSAFGCLYIWFRWRSERKRWQTESRDCWRPLRDTHRRRGGERETAHRNMFSPHISQPPWVHTGTMWKAKLVLQTPIAQVSVCVCLCVEDGALLLGYMVISGVEN